MGAHVSVAYSGTTGAGANGTGRWSELREEGGRVGGCFCRS